MYQQPMHWGYVGIMEKRMETIGIIQGLHRDHIGIMEKNMETTI